MSAAKFVAITTDD